MPNQSARTTRFTIRLPNDLLNELEQEAKARGPDVSVASVLIERARAMSAAKVRPEIDLQPRRASRWADGRPIAKNP